MNYSAVILLGGSSERFFSSFSSMKKTDNLQINKVFYPILNKPLFVYPVQLFCTDKECTQIILVYNKNEHQLLEKYLVEYFKNHLNKIILVEGGDYRQRSVLNGLDKVTNSYVLVHDGARPNINITDINNVKEALKTCDCTSLSVKVFDTIKECKDEVIKTVDRTYLYYVQTPQGSKLDVLKKALLECKEEVTDDLMAVEKYTKAKISLCEGSKKNIKITRYEDYELVKLIMGDKND